MKHALLLFATCLAVGCGTGSGSSRHYLLQGAWVLSRAEYPEGQTQTFTDTKETVLRLYEGDSVMYEGMLTRTASGLIVKPGSRWGVTLIDKGNGEILYLENDNPRPLTLKNDTTIIVQQQGVRYTWHRDDGIAAAWGTEISELIAAKTRTENTDEWHSYMLSARERQQASFIKWLWAAIAAIVTLAVAGFAAGRRRRRHLQLQLQQLQEIREERPTAVRQAIETIETAYFTSDEYHDLQRRMATGQLLKDDDWQYIMGQVRRVYPGFISYLRGLYPMSELEQRVCLLVKLRVSPTDIAAVLARDASTVSTVRSRLYKKVFGRKGGAKEWDEFIRSIGVG